MQLTADVAEDPGSSQSFYVLTPDRLYDFLLHRADFCDVLDSFHRDMDDIIDTSLPWRSTFFSKHPSHAAESFWHLDDALNIEIIDR
mmetsp:Transcript_5401/g.17746  ORF Transcript_5401/g.17746 Transcript_5401/m.17746 type:complete len:87 (+) Transcript_5401:170-430(+)